MNNPLTALGDMVLGLFLMAFSIALALGVIQCRQKASQPVAPAPLSEPVPEPLSVNVPTPVEMTPPKELVAPDDAYVQERLLFYAIAQTEGWSGVDTPGPDGERGKYQVTPIWWEDCNRITGEDLPFTAFYYTQEELVESRMLFYWFFYGAKTDKEKAMCHNAGPDWRKKPPLEYWKEVQTYLPKEK